MKATKFSHLSVLVSVGYVYLYNLFVLFYLFSFLRIRSRFIVTRVMFLPFEAVPSSSSSSCMFFLFIFHHVPYSVRGSAFRTSRRYQLKPSFHHHLPSPSVYRMHDLLSVVFLLMPQPVRVAIHSSSNHLEDEAVQDLSFLVPCPVNHVASSYSLPSVPSKVEQLRLYSYMYVIVGGAGDVWFVKRCEDCVFGWCVCVV